MPQLFYPPLIRPQRGLAIPSGTPEIDWTNPKTRGLSTVFLPGTISHTLQGGGAGQYQLDNLVTWATEPVTGTGRGNFVYANNSPLLVSSGFGAGVMGNGSNSGFLNLGADPIQQQPATAVTLLWFGVMNSTTDYSTMIGVAYAGGVSPYVCYTLGSGAASGHQLYLSWNGGGTEEYIVTSAMPAIFDIPVVIVATIDANSAQIYCNGILIASGPGLTAPIQYGGANPLQFTTGNVNHDTGYMAAIWNTALSPGEIVDLCGNPTEFLLYPADTVMSSAVGDYKYTPPTPPPPPPPPPPLVTNYNPGTGSPPTYIIPLQALPNQTVTVALNNQNCTVTARQTSTGLYTSLAVNNAPIISGVISQNLNVIVRDAYLGFIGDLAWIDTQPDPIYGPSDPFYSGIGTRFFLAYYDPSVLPAWVQ